MDNCDDLRENDLAVSNIGLCGFLVKIDEVSNQHEYNCRFGCRHEDVHHSSDDLFVTLLEEVVTEVVGEDTYHLLQNFVRVRYQSVLAGILPLPIPQGVSYVYYYHQTQHLYVFVFVL